MTSVAQFHGDRRQATEKATLPLLEGPSEPKTVCCDSIHTGYDNEGNRISQTKISDSTKVEYTWDYRNRLTDVFFKTSGGTVTKKVQYQYDVFNRRIGKKTDADGNGTYDSATYWVYDNAGKRDPNTRTSLDDIVLEFNDADGDGTGLATLTTRYLHGPQFDQVLASETTSGNVVTWALADHHGTVRDMVRYASGTTTVVNHRKFDAFGNVTAESDATVKFLYSYTGREWDGDAGLYYYRARWYDAKIGRFISEDPLGFAARDTNTTRYVGNSPINGTDPAGLDSYWGTFFWELPGAYYDTVVSGQQSDSLDGAFSGMIDCMTWGNTDYSNVMPQYGNVDAYLNGREVGFWWGVANQVAVASWGTYRLYAAYLAANPSTANRLVDVAAQRMPVQTANQFLDAEILEAQAKMHNEYE